ncbi:inverse autotransporter beta domain-containing protein [Planctomicrobium sp. SH661]|uniref:inverse autotransporter beta domain-containing protein n=1 Tax=Planctomicrobium sp. SH661 TaxID=3448124 RepID=UPI003F5B9DC2
MRNLLKFRPVNSNGVRTPLRRFLQASGLCACLSASTLGLAQEFPDEKPAEKKTEATKSFVFPEDESGTLSFPDVESNFVDRTMIPNNDKVDRASGIDGRIGFIGLPAFGRDHSIVPVELFPYLQMNNQILFGDFRGFINTEGKVGGNAGVGFRFIEPSEMALFGINGFYDSDDSTGRSFQQLSVGWEARMEMAGLFGNVYMPVSTTEKTLSQTIINERFNEHNILFDVRNRIGKAMTGLDINFQAYLPGDFMKSHQVQASAGWYHFQGGAEVADINGYKLQLQGNIVPAIGTLTSVTHDNTYGTNFNIGVFWQFGTRELPGTSLQGQLRRFVDRNYNVILAKSTKIDAGVVAQNPDGTVLIVQHVGQNTGGPGTGTVDDPFTSITAAQGAAQSPNLIYMHSGTVVSDTVVLQDGQTLLGEGTAFRMRDDRYGWFHVPGGSSTGATPRIEGSAGDAVTMGNNTTIAGISIVDSQGRGIVAQDKNNVRISNVKVENSTGDGVYLDGITGSSVSNLTVSGSGGNGLSIIDIDDVLNLDNIYVEDTTGYGIHIDGGLGSISFEDDVIIRRTAMAALKIENMERLEEVDDKGTTTTTDDVTTITPSVITFEKLVIRNAGGTYGGGIESNDNGGLIGFGAVDIQTQGAAAIHSRDDNALLVSNGYLNTIGAPVADIEDSSVSISLTEIKADGGAVGLRLVDTTGSFLVFGDGSTVSSGGFIKNTDVAVLMENAGTVGFQSVDFTDNGKMAEVDGGAALIIAGSKVTGTTDMLIDAKNLTQLQVYQSDFENNPLSSNLGIRYVVDKVGTYSASVSNNLVTNMPGTFFTAETLAGGETSSLTYAFRNNAVQLSSAGGIAAKMDWTGSVLAYAMNNTIAGSQTGQTAIQLRTGSGTALGQIYANQNLITLTGVNSIGIDLETQAPANVIADANEINMNGMNQTAIRALLGKASAVAMASNIIKDNAGGGTGILFTSIEDGSQIALDNNKIDLSQFNTFVDRGIVVAAFTAADGDPPLVTFFSTASNTITGATTTYSFPASGGRGRVIINDTPVIFP